jgi:hypothetical protein
LCGVVGGGPLSTGQVIEGDVGTVGESEFWARTPEVVIKATTERSNNRIISEVYNPDLRTYDGWLHWRLHTLPCGTWESCGTVYRSE